MPVAQLMQSAFPGPEQDAQLESQGLHFVVVADIYCPVGQGFTHVFPTAPYPVVQFVHYEAVHAKQLDGHDVQIQVEVSP